MQRKEELGDSIESELSQSCTQTDTVCWALRWKPRVRSLSLSLSLSLIVLMALFREETTVSRQGKQLWRHFLRVSAHKKRNKHQFRQSIGNQVLCSPGSSSPAQLGWSMVATEKIEWIQKEEMCLFIWVIWLPWKSALQLTDGSDIESTKWMENGRESVYSVYCIARQCETNIFAAHWFDDAATVKVRKFICNF